MQQAIEVLEHNSESYKKNVGNLERGASVLAGSILIYTGLRQRSWAGLGLGVAGAGLIARGISGHCAAYRALGVRTTEDDPTKHISVPYGEGIRVDKTVTVNKPRFEVYAFWRNLENLPSFMQHLERVRQTSDRVSHWVAKAPLGRTVEWDAEIISDEPGERIGWRSLAGADVNNAGSVHFTDAAANRGTEVKVELQFIPPGGVLGSLVAKILGEHPEQQVEEDLRRFKMMLETGEISTTLKAHSEAAAKNGTAKTSKEEDVQNASEESFPASDAPAWR